MQEAREPAAGLVVDTRITLKRFRWPPGDLGRAYKVFVDDREVGSIRRGQQESFEVPPGHHRIQLKIDWCTSPEVAVDLGAGEEASLGCKARWPSTLATTITTQRNSYIVLELLPGAGH